MSLKSGLSIAAVLIAASLAASPAFAFIEVPMPANPDGGTRFADPDSLADGLADNMAGGGDGGGMSLDFDMFRSSHSSVDSIPKAADAPTVKPDANAPAQR